MKRIIFCIIITLILLFSVSAMAEIMKCDADIIAFFQTQTDSAFTMKTTSDMYERLTKDDCSVLGKLELMGGISNAKVYGTLIDYGTFEFSDIERIEQPYVYAESEETFIRSIAEFAENNVTDFSIICMDKLYEQMKDDAGHFELLVQLSSLDTYAELQINNGSGIVCHFSEITYTDSPKLLCITKDDILSVMCEMCGAGITEYIIITNPEVFDQLAANDFEELCKLERDAGIIDRELSYDATRDEFIYNNVVSVTEAEELRTIDDLRVYIETCALNGDTSITAVCSDALYEKIMSDRENNPELPLLDCIIQNSGIFRYATTLKDDRMTITINVIDYYPGMNIARAYNSGSVNDLTQREVETLKECESLASLCISETPLQTYANIHDAICTRVSYSSDSKDLEKDTAIGALLNHSADCDGYADAYYAIASIAGLPVRYQCGASGPVGEDSSHMWNLISIAGTWRATDATWDDETTDPVYIWFNIGTDRLSVNHRWNQETTVEITQTTDLEERPDAEYLVDSKETLENAISDALSKDTDEFTVFFTEESEELHEQVCPALREKGFIGVVNYFWDETMRSFTVELGDR